MFKKLFLISLLLAFATWAWASNAAKNNDERSVLSSKKLDKSLISKTESAKQPITIYGTDFETEGEWGVQQLGDEGAVFEWVTDNYLSESHSWWVPDDTPMTAEEAIPIETAIVSPEVALPSDIEGYAPKVLELSYWGDVETPNTADEGSVYDVWQIEMELPYEGDNFWHTDTHMGYEGTSSWWCGDPSVGTYDLNWRQELWTPVLDLTGAAGPVMLTFKNAPSSEPAYDYCFLEISSDDGVSWDRLDRWDEENDPLVWYDESYDISAYASATTIVRWRFTSDGGYNSPNGWHIDNIEITDGTTQFVFDDGGDTATQLVAIDHPVSWVRMHYDYDDGRFGDTWFMIDNTIIYNGSLDLRPYAGLSTNFRIRVSTDGYNRLGLAPGYGYYFDDFEIYGQGVAEIDGAVYGVGGLFAVSPDQVLNIKVYAANEGLTPLNNVLWYGEIKDAMGEVVASPVGRWEGTIEVGEVVAIETLEPRRWTPTHPGVYTFDVTTLQVNQDGYLPNNELLGTEFMVYGPPYSELIYVEDFEAYGAADELEDFGWTIVNGGGNDLTGSNVNSWVYSNGLGIYGYGAECGWAWTGNLDLGPDLDAVLDSSEVLDESIISPPIDLSGVGGHNTLGVNLYTYYRPGYPGYSPPFGTNPNSLSLDWSVDGGETWVNAFIHDNDDSVYIAATDRLPNGIYGGDPVVGYLNYLDFDVTPAMAAAKAASNTVQFRIGFFCENSYFFNVSIDHFMVYAGVSQPIILGVNDVPEDQGKEVHLVFKGSYNDLLFQLPNEPVGDIISVPVTRYDVWRHDAVNLGGDMVWTYVASVPASDHKVYGVVVPTLLDEVETEYTIEAKTAMPEVWAMAEPMAGMSMDNLAPEAPLGLVVSGEDTKNVLAWEEAYTPVDDLNYYSVYRSTTSGSYPDEPIATTVETYYEDSDVVVDTKYYYVVTATDFAGNESDYSSETEWTTGVIGVARAGIPTEYELTQNYPNPFNPTTTIEFALPEASNVTLKVYNVAGQEIANLVQDRMEAGYHKVSWDASSLSGGVYIAELRAGSFVKTMKMVLTK